MVVEIVQTIDALAGERVLIYGSLPPEGRDLDLLVRPAAARDIRQGLVDRGWLSRGARCAWFHDCTVEVIELLPAAGLGLPERQLESLFAEAQLCDGTAHLCHPAPAHALLILARRYGRGDGRLAAKHRRRIEVLVERQPDVWEVAALEAPPWGAQTALRGLRATHSADVVLGPARRAAAIQEELTSRGEPRASARMRAWRSAVSLPSRRRGFVVTLSGLDGAGKSTQATALRDTLDRLGIGTEVQWTSLSAHPPFLHTLTGSVNTLLHAASGLVPARATAGVRRATASAPDQVGSSPETLAGRLRQRSRMVGAGWTSLLALRAGLAHRRVARPHLSRGRVVICDRYVLDSQVQLRHQYPELGHAALQSWLVRTLSPKPDLAVFLQVSAHTASTRKADYELSENERRARLYDEEATKLGVMRLDGERPRAEVCAELATRVWSALRQG